MEDALYFQHDLDDLNSWSKINNLSFNLSKCLVVHLSHKKMLYLFDYLLDGVNLSVADDVRDLGVIFSGNLSFDKHIRFIASAAFKKLGFINRCGKHFKQISTIKLLFCTLVRPQLEYASVVWDSYQLNHGTLIERIQHCFLCGLSFRLGKPLRVTDHNYDDLLIDLNLLTLSKRRIFLSLLFLYRLLNGVVASPELLERIRLIAPSRTLRFNSLFYLQQHRTSYGMFKPLNRLCLLANSPTRIDFFHPQLNSFRNSLLRCLN